MNEVTISREEFEMRREHSIQCAKDKKVLRKQVLRLEKSVKRHVQEAEDAMLQRDELVTALQGVIAAFCPGPEGGERPVRKTADTARDAAMLKTPNELGNGSAACGASVLTDGLAGKT